MHIEQVNISKYKAVPAEVRVGTGTVPENPEPAYEQEPVQEPVQAPPQEVITPAQPQEVIITEPVQEPEVQQ